ncbi:prepilin peptidase [Candidatus Saccharibacteria bacterium]|nr:prepilin peptidase [Candidatus Saccharibacteria bacterium]
MLIIEIVFLILLFCFGAILGSFSCCQAWRIRLKETGKKDPGKWSVCLSCGKRLKPSENVPIVSWIVQRGKCRKCGAKIGRAEIFSEIGLGCAFVLIGMLFFPELYNALVIDINIIYILLLISIMLVLFITMTIMWILLIYDAKWQLLPTRLLTTVIIMAAIYLAIRIVGMMLGGMFLQDFLKILPSILAGVALLAGTYLLLYRLSGERLVGSGDWLLALAISLILGNWWLCLLVLFLSNFMGSVVGIYYKAKKGQKAIPFGPFLVLAFVIVYAFQAQLMVAVY